MKTNIHFGSHVVQFSLKWEMFQKKFVDKVKTHILRSVTLSRKSCRLWDNLEKLAKAGQATDKNMAHVNWILNNWSYRNALTKCNTFPLQQLLHEPNSVFRDTYIASFVSLWQQ